jgi:hypothetical protein
MCYTVLALYSHGEHASQFTDSWVVSDMGTLSTLIGRRFIKGRLHQVLNHTLYEVHWVWSGAAYNKQQNMRDAGGQRETVFYTRAVPAERGDCAQFVLTPEASAQFGPRKSMGF